MKIFTWRINKVSIMACVFVFASITANATPLMSTDGLIKVDLKPITAITSANFDSGLFGAFPGWTVTKGAATAGSLSTSTYSPQVIYGASGNTAAGGAEIKASYVNPSAPPTGKQFEYIQIASTTGFGPSYSTPHLDPLNNDDTLPFYWTQSESASMRNAVGSRIDFSDKPQAPLSGLKNGPVSFTGELFVSEWDGATSVTVRDGFSWGYDMTLATDGKSAATFKTPSPSCPPATCSGVGTSAFSWGDGSSFGSPPSSLSFTPAAFTPSIDSKFKIGDLSYFNGTIAAGTEVNMIDLIFDLSFGFGTTFGTPFQLDATLSLINTSNGGVDPFADADFVSFILGGFTGNFHVFEGQSASIPLYAQLTSHGDVVAEKQLIDASFTGLTQDFAGFGTPTGGGFVTNVPEPSSMILVLTGLGLFLMVGLRKNSKNLA
ncbi:MAG: choice-of-anchor K domain-containing protein [Proteobacteria bacterium]|nr:choice-of-anchor K domain-containing protein [Pseudomonadota bacterium]